MKSTARSTFDGVTKDLAISSLKFDGEGLLTPPLDPPPGTAMFDYYIRLFFKPDYDFIRSKSITFQVLYKIGAFTAALDTHREANVWN